MPKPQYNQHGDPNFIEAGSLLPDKRLELGDLAPRRRPQDGPPMSDATRALHEAILRSVKGIVKAYEEWLSRQ